MVQGTRDKSAKSWCDTRLQNHLTTVTILMRAPSSPRKQSESNLFGEQRLTTVVARRLHDFKPCVHQTVLQSICQVAVACDQRATDLATKSLGGCAFPSKMCCGAARASKYGSESRRARHHRFHLYHGAVINAAASMTTLTLGWASSAPP